ncbi:VOC family protein [Haloarchaeobius sp. DFWS5]|uniref:VOC family protein n=1 Tax=Haloarchaeobius sp. DFWS5 TaxID=3446114 RepID=UPI003EB7AC33
MSTITDITHVTVLVDDQQEALDYYTEALGFEEMADMEMDDGGRWVTVTPAGESTTELALVEADTDEKRDLVGRQAADHVFCVLETDDCHGLFETLSGRGVEFTTEPEEVPWGIHATFLDCYGNRYNVVEPGEWDGEQ